MKSVVVITPTIGLKSLRKAIDSVAAQTYQKVRHLVVVDGEDYFGDTIFNPDLDDVKADFEILRTNTGKNGFYGHRIYAAFSHLVNEDYVFFLDEDNWYESAHVEHLVDTLQNNDFAFSLRNIYDENENFLFQDNCESLGKWPIWCSKNDYMVDTSAYAFDREFLIKVAHFWHYGYGGDRRFFNIVRGGNGIRYDTSGQYTLNYRLGSSSTSASPQFFEAGNAETQKLKVNNKYPWEKPWKII